MISRALNHSLLALPHVEQTMSLAKNLPNQGRTLEKEGYEDRCEEKATVVAVVHEEEGLSHRRKNLLLGEMCSMIPILRKMIRWIARVIGKT